MTRSETAHKLYRLYRVFKNNGMSAHAARIEAKNRVMPKQDTSNSLMDGMESALAQLNDLLHDLKELSANGQYMRPDEFLTRYTVKVF